MKADSQTATAQNKKNVKGKKRSKTTKFIFTVIKICLILGIVVTFVSGFILAGVIYGWVKTAEPVTPDSLKLNNFATIIYDSEGNELTYVFNENRIWVDFKDIPDKLVQAFISIEDERFYQHNGIDLRRIAGVTVGLITQREFVGGGSTITQQVIKMITHDDDFSLKRKVVEQWRALQLEKVVEKNTILETYMNVIYLGQGAHGVQTAAKVYFDKDVNELSLSECATIAGITNLPEVFDPFKNMEASKKRRNIILGKMLELGYIQKDEFDQAVKEDIVLNRGTIKQTSVMPYFVEEVLADIKEDLIKEKKMSRSEAQTMIDTGGLRIYTTMDPAIQGIMDKVYQNEDKYFKKYTVPSNIKDPRPQSAMVVIDHRTGEVKALTGGRGVKDANLVTNRATDEKRQPGSTMKPIGVYAPLLESKQVTAAAVFEDLPLILPGYHPHNYGFDYQGLSSIRDSIKLSTNIIAVKAWLALGADASHDFLINKLGITSIRTDKNDPQNDRNPAMALGGVTDGITPMEMTAAYIPFANKGMMIEPVLYKKVTFSTGKELLVKKSQGKPVMSEANAYIMTSMLKDVVVNGTAWQARFNSGPTKGMASAGKTGTTNDNKDKWFIGFTPYYLAGVWYGYSPTPIPFPEEGQALNIWGDIMHQIHELKKLPVKNFDEPSGIVKVQICRDSGKLPGPLCKDDPRNQEADSYWHRIREEIFAKGTEPKEVCDQHVKVKVCTETNQLATPYCPPAAVAEKVMVKGLEPLDPRYKEDPADAKANFWDLKFRTPTETCTTHKTAPAPSPSPSPSPSGNTPQGFPGPGSIPGLENLFPGLFNGGNPTPAPTPTPASGNNGNGNGNGRR